MINRKMANFGSSAPADQRSTGRLGRLGATLSLTGISILGVNVASSETVEADHCPPGMRHVDLADGNIACIPGYENSGTTAPPPPSETQPPATQPAATNPPSNGGGNSGGSGGGSSSGGSGDSNAGTPATPAPAPQPSAWELHLAETCPDQTGHPALALALADAHGGTGSQRIVDILAACDVHFEGEVDEELGRPTTNVEAIIADPENDVTPNDAQLQVLNRELLIYWRIVEEMTLAQGVPDEKPESSEPASAVSEP